ncbi:hypothetical protein [Kitasatospora sp. NBC_01539]|uniref:hypothetical protein n=1 Tax=Kitasatospora sp. NBC_01539 TaxID=2903577 RepID=UPI0038600B39
MCATIVTNGGHDVQDSRCGHTSVEVWTLGAGSLSQYTQALGWNGTGPFPYAGDVAVKTDVRC